jgi:ergothioneine biosynthesis protein EgtB
MPRASLRDDFLAVRGTTIALAEPLTPEDQMVQSMADASPTKWHLAHTTWFFETFVLGPFRPGYQPFHPAFAELYNSYYEAVGPRVARAERGLLSRPSLAEVHAYRRQVDEVVVGALAAEQLPPPALALVTLGLHHEQQHQELVLTDIKHALSRNPMRPTYRQGHRPPAATPPLTFIPFAEGLVSIGQGGDGSAFAFDNEGPRHRVYLRPFALASRLVTCGEYLAFIDDGGYRRPELWLSDGWDTARSHSWKAPLYWAERQGDEIGWIHHTLGGTRPVDPAEPVCHVSHYEADAYARWADARLPTEAEWERAAAPRPVQGNFLESARLHPCGGDDLYGDLWQWTGTPYAPYPGYRPPPGALGEYNGKFMSNQMVLRGGSCFSPRSHLRATYRNFFPPAARWQMTGIRLAQDA